MAKIVLTQQYTTQDPPEYWNYVKEHIISNLGYEVSKLLQNNQGKYITFCFTQEERRLGWADSPYPVTEMVYQIEYAFAREIEVAIPTYSYTTDPDYMFPKPTVGSSLRNLWQAVKEWRW